MARVSLKTGPGVFEVLAHVCRSPQEAVKQFVENAADAVDQVEAEERSISIKLGYEAAPEGAKVQTLRSIVVQDNGIGMSLEKLSQVVQRIGDSEKLDLMLRGEKGIGILAFALVAQELHLCSTPAEGIPSNCLVLKREWLRSGRGEIVERCSSHNHLQRGTLAYLEGILPEVAGQLMKERLKEYLGREFASDLRRNLYALSILDGPHPEPIQWRRFRGVKALSAGIPLGEAGHIFSELYVLPWEMQDATISLYGRSGMRICLISDLDDFKCLPWNDKRLEGYIRCDRLKRTADKTAIVQDETYKAMVSKLKSIEPFIQEQIDKVSQESQEHRFAKVVTRVGRLIDKFLRYRERGLLPELAIQTRRLIAEEKGTIRSEQDDPSKPPIEQKPAAKRPAVVFPTRAPHIQLLPPPESKALFRSWYNPDDGVICINREHTEFVLSERDDRRCLRYLFNIWAKESLLQEYGEDAQRVADEMVGILAEAEPLLR